MEFKVGNIIKTETAWSEFQNAYQQAFYLKIAPQIKDEIHRIAQEEIYKDKVSDLALRRRRPVSSRLGSYKNIKVEGNFVTKNGFKIYYNDETRPQDPIKEDCTWYDDIFLIDLVSGTLKENIVEGVIPNIFTYPKNYPWSKPSHRMYRQKIDQYLNSDKVSYLYQREISKYPAVILVIEKYFVEYVNELMRSYKQNNVQK